LNINGMKEKKKVKRGVGTEKGGKGVSGGTRAAPAKVSKPSPLIVATMRSCRRPNALDKRTSKPTHRDRRNRLQKTRRTFGERKTSPITRGVARFSCSSPNAGAIRLRRYSITKGVTRDTTKNSSRHTEYQRAFPEGEEGARTLNQILSAKAERRHGSGSHNAGKKGPREGKL